MAGDRDAEDQRFIRAAYAVFNTGDVDAALAYYTDDIEWHDALDPGFHVFHGSAELRTFWLGVHASLEGFRVEPQRFLRVAEGHYLVLVRSSGRGRASGIEVAREIAQEVRLREDKVCRLDSHPDAAEAMRRLGVG